MPAVERADSAGSAAPVSAELAPSPAATESAAASAVACGLARGGSAAAFLLRSGGAECAPAAASGLVAGKLSADRGGNPVSNLRVDGGQKKLPGELCRGCGGGIAHFAPFEVMTLALSVPQLPWLPGWPVSMLSLIYSSLSSKPGPELLGVQAFSHGRS